MYVDLHDAAFHHGTSRTRLDALAYQAAKNRSFMQKMLRSVRVLEHPRAVWSGVAIAIAATIASAISGAFMVLLGSMVLLGGVLTMLLSGLFTSARPTQERGTKRLLGDHLFLSAASAPGGGFRVSIDMRNAHEVGSAPLNVEVVRGLYVQRRSDLWKLRKEVALVNREQQQAADHALTAAYRTVAREQADARTASVWT